MLELHVHVNSIKDRPPPSEMEAATFQALYCKPYVRSKIPLAAKLFFTSTDPQYSTQICQAKPPTPQP